jgi:hypothetical protein
MFGFVAASSEVRESRKAVRSVFMDGMARIGRKMGAGE